MEGRKEGEDSESPEQAAHVREEKYIWLSPSSGNSATPL